jgi:hypothetical protein
MGILQVLKPLISLVVNIVIQIISFRCISGLGLLKSIFCGFFCGFFCVIFWELSILFIYSKTFNDSLGLLLADTIIYVSLSYCYFHFINLGETARRIRIIREIYDSQSGLSMDDILERYNSKEIVEKRITRLLASGQIISKNRKYYISNPIMLLISKIMIFLKILLLGKKKYIERL